MLLQLLLLLMLLLLLLLLLELLLLLLRFLLFLLLLLRLTERRTCADNFYGSDDRSRFLPAQNESQFHSSTFSETEHWHPGMRSDFRMTAHGFVGTGEEFLNKYIYLYNTHLACLHHETVHVRVHSRPYCNSHKRSGMRAKDNVPGTLVKGCFFLSPSRFPSPCQLHESFRHLWLGMVIILLQKVTEC